jgi:subtilisin family serine protease
MRRPTARARRYLVQVAAQTDPREVGRQSAARTHGLLGRVYRRAVRGYAIHLPAGVDERELRRHPGVVRVERDIRVQAAAQVTPTGVRRIQAEKVDADGPIGVDVAIIDTGIDLDHPDLNVAGGRRFYTRLWWSLDDEQYNDDNGHGTHTAGIVAARDNAIGVVGVAPGARLWAVKVLDADGYGYLSDVIAGVEWVTENAGTIEVANLSLTAVGHSEIFRTAIQNSVKAGVVYFAAAGNEAADVFGADGVFGTDDDTIPAAYPEVAAVAAMADSDGVPGGHGSVTSAGEYLDDSFAAFSNFSSVIPKNTPVTSPGAAIDLLMPGVAIESTYLNGGYSVGSGTSMASPHAAGLAALYIARNGRAFGQSGVIAIRQALIDAGMDQASGKRLAHRATEPDTHPEKLGWAGFSGPLDRPPTVDIAKPAPGATVSGTVTISVTADDDDAVTQVEFSVDGISLGVDDDPNDGWSIQWDATAASTGRHTLRATATDTIGQTASDWMRVTVQDTNNPPSVTLTNPASETTVAGTVAVTASASDDQAVVQVAFFVDGADIGVGTNGKDGWAVQWDTTTSQNGPATITATATDTEGETTSHSVTVHVANAEAATATMHVSTIDVSYSRYWGALIRYRATVSISDAQGDPVSGAAVTGALSGDVNTGSITRQTGASGTVTFEASKRGWYARGATFCVENVNHSERTYAPEDNEETCDSSR